VRLPPTSSFWQNWICTLRFGLALFIAHNWSHSCMFYPGQSWRISELLWTQIRRSGGDWKLKAEVEEFAKQFPPIGFEKSSIKYKRWSVYKPHLMRALETELIRLTSHLQQPPHFDNLWVTELCYWKSNCSPSWSELWLHCIPPYHIELKIYTAFWIGLSHCMQRMAEVDYSS
jgi:hypothetical protein